MYIKTQFYTIGDISYIIKRTVTLRNDFFKLGSYLIFIVTIYKKNDKN